MKFRHALKRAEENGEVKKCKQEGYFLSSGVSIVSDDKTPSWTVIYTLEGGKKVVNVMVDKTVTVSREDKELSPVSDKLLDVSSIKFDEVLKKARLFAGEFKKPVAKEIVSIHQEEFPVWKVVFITPALDVIVVQFNAETGEKVSSELTSLIMEK